MRCGGSGASPRELQLGPRRGSIAPGGSPRWYVLQLTPEQALLDPASYVQLKVGVLSKPCQPLYRQLCCQGGQEIRVKPEASRKALDEFTWACQAADSGSSMTHGGLAGCSSSQPSDAIRKVQAAVSSPESRTGLCRAPGFISSP